MTTFVLVHGAWHGASAWDRVTALLARSGMRSLTPELRAEPGVGLHEHARQVVDAVDAVDEDVVLVGHSYAGLVVRQAADRRPDRVRHIVLIDGWAGGNGVSLFDLAPHGFVHAIRTAAQDGSIPAPAPAAFGITEPADAAWLAPRLRAHPLASFTEPTALTGAVERVPGTAICCRPSAYPFQRFAAELGYDTRLLDGPHDILLTAPQTVADLLIEVGCLIKSAVNLESAVNFESQKGAH
ncbi:alpha/beta fold hydrolase [Catellatospora tritici]|uniref:alpha/beta fold hydrolase n=1 Tax=Catellatospora tritici TaxID=2851566 RepID=UPI001C2D02EA|nr:alpha/beta hydrolase family protein [Catellatospora tritici]MBV1851245.1 alpha/beta fold hydrolase [Catellatospora tritici]